MCGCQKQSYFHKTNRWKEEGCLEITISAHAKQHSLIQVTGLKSSPRLVLVVSPLGSTNPLHEVGTADEMVAHTDGAYLTTRLSDSCYEILVALDRSSLGNAITLYT